MTFGLHTVVFTADYFAAKLLLPVGFEIIDLATLVVVISCVCVCRRMYLGEVVWSVFAVIL